KSHSKSAQVAAATLQNTSVAPNIRIKEQTKKGTTISFKLRDGNRQGSAVEEWPNGDLLKFRYQDGKRHGTAVQTSKDGATIEFRYDNGVIQDDICKTSPDGSKLRYTRKVVTTTDGQKKSIAEGPCEEYLPSGEVCSFTMKNDLREGLATL